MCISERGGTVRGVMSKLIDEVRVVVKQEEPSLQMNEIYVYTQSEVIDPSMSNNDIIGGENAHGTRKEQHCTLAFGPQKRYQSEKRQNIGLGGHLWYNFAGSAMDSEQRQFVDMASVETSRVGGEPGEVDQHKVGGN